MTTTLDGYVPAPGDLVWQQMWSPQQPTPDSSIHERVAHGTPYGERRLMVVDSVTPGHDAHDYARSLGADLPPRIVTQWVLLPADPALRRRDAYLSIVEDDWCVLELVPPADDGRLF